MDAGKFPTVLCIACLVIVVVGLVVTATRKELSSSRVREEGKFEVQSLALCARRFKEHKGVYARDSEQLLKVIIYPSGSIRRSTLPSQSVEEIVQTKRVINPEEVFLWRTNETAFQKLLKELKVPPARQWMVYMGSADGSTFVVTGSDPNGRPFRGGNGLPIIWSAP